MMNLTKLESLVWCEATTSPHDMMDTDPEGYGPDEYDPQAKPGSRADYSDNPAWTLEDRDDTYGKVWHYDCPGPHYQLWRGRELSWS